ncbi:MAG: ABC-2 family transporter protein [Leptolyngbyaceae bacterium]|nr:ABC-2 family transporter protein [Leptolyngbyaceae bacterium]
MLTLKRSFRLTSVLLSTYYAYMVEYRAELLFWVLSGSLPLILMGVWSQAADGGDFGFSSLEFIRYFIAVFFVRQFSIVWVIWEFERQVVEGTLSPKLLQPMDPAWHHFASHFAERFARMPFVIVLLVLFFAVYPAAFWIPSAARLVLALIVLHLAFVLRFIMQYTFAMLAFWTERANAVENFWFLPYLFLSGIIAPLEVFPPGVRAVVSWLPFPYLIHFPASLLLGIETNIVKGLLIMLMWIGFFFLMNRLLWRKGIRQYSGMGA